MGRIVAELERFKVDVGERTLVVLGRLMRSAAGAVLGAKLFVGASGESDGQGILLRFVLPGVDTPLCTCVYPSVCQVHELVPSCAELVGMFAGKRFRPTVFSLGDCERHRCAL